ncbi:hypothetical protein [Bacillus cereus]|uniref:hypothetical protein n=1 Tax=Bacillus cereus TaxID=1396 RepID=UPI0039869191
MYVKKGFIGILLATACLVFNGCSADMKEVETATKDKLEDSQLGPYIEKVTYKPGEKKDDYTPVSVQIKTNEKFYDLSKMETYAAMNDAFDKIIGSYNQVSCGGNNKCDYKDIQVFYGKDTYVMDIMYRGLLINDFETYTKNDYIVDMDRVDKVNPTDKYNESHNMTPTPSSGQGSTSTYDPKKDSANYDANGNYKPVDQMKPEEIKKELEGMLEESLKK